MVMACYWICEVLPMAATALIPLLLYPSLGIMTSADVASNYLKVKMIFCSPTLHALQCVIVIVGFAISFLSRLFHSYCS